MDAADLRRAAVAVLGLDTTTGTPPLITEAAVIYLDGGVISAGPFAYWVAPDAPTHQIRHQSWPEARLAPAWPQVAEQVQLALSDRVLVTHDASRLDVLRRHLPDWEPPAGVAHTRDLAEQAWPGLANYALGPATVRAGINDIPRVGPSAVVEAHAIALLLAALTRRAYQRHERPRHPTRPDRPTSCPARRRALGTLPKWRGGRVEWWAGMQRPVTGWRLTAPVWRVRPG